ncbi:MAG: gephyrin-like molybdotransferase Glp [Hyphomicrobiales bacterium]
MKSFIGFTEALELTLSNVAASDPEELLLLDAVGRILADDVGAKVDSPSVSTSLKDGYAVHPEDLKEASSASPVHLKLVGRMGAGDLRPMDIHRGQAIRVTTGALIPEGAGAVVSEEFCRLEGETLACFNTAEPGRNILQRGTDVRTGEIMAAHGGILTPALLGLIAAAGHGTVRVHRLPRTAVIATGDEVVAPGDPLPDGKLYASNMVEICSWLALHRIPFENAIIGDRRDDIHAAIQDRLDRTDVFITSGGAWGSEKDLILQVAADLGWMGIYRRVRMGPGKPVGFGLLNGKPFFVLPGGPPSNEMAFLQLALPALMKMKGAGPKIFPLVPARLASAVTGEREWTEFIHARLQRADGELWVSPARLKSRLRSMAEKDALIVIPEDRDEIPAGEVIEVQLLQLAAPI